MKDRIFCIGGTNINKRKAVWIFGDYFGRVIESGFCQYDYSCIAGIKPQLFACYNAVAYAIKNKMNIELYTNYQWFPIYWAREDFKLEELNEKTILDSLCLEKSLKEMQIKYYISNLKQIIQKENIKIDCFFRNAIPIILKEKIKELLNGGLND